MVLRPAPHVRLAAVGGDLVLLDLAEDAYYCLAEALEPRDGLPTDRLRPEARELLLEEGRLIRCAGEGPACDPGECAVPPGPERDLRAHPDLTPGFGDLLALFLALADLARLGRDPTIARLLSLAAPTASPASDPERVERAARVFAGLLPWLPCQGACLRRSALLIAFLRRRGLSARWVFGVRVWPFRAHCWVETDELCLNDDLERLASYTPILAA